MQILHRFNGSVLLDVPGSTLTGADLTRVNLYLANLTGADLTRVNLYLANLYLANLTRVNLYLANLTGANLTGANLTGANLAGVNLTRADLTGANLTGVNLTRADLTGANLAGVNLCGANLTGTCLDPTAEIPAISDKTLTENGLRLDGEYVYGWRTATSQYNGSAFYLPGTTHVAPVFSVADTLCHPGIYMAGKNYLKIHYPDVKTVPCRSLRADLHHAGGKFRTRRLEIL